MTLLVAAIGSFGNVTEGGYSFGLRLKLISSSHLFAFVVRPSGSRSSYVVRPPSHPIVARLGRAPSPPPSLCRRRVDLPLAARCAAPVLLPTCFSENSPLFVWCSGRLTVAPCFAPMAAFVPAPLAGARPFAARRSGLCSRRAAVASSLAVSARMSHGGVNETPSRVTASRTLCLPCWDLWSGAR